jgi:DNA-binding GntR family transcriptional regulator
MKTQRRIRDLRQRQANAVEKSITTGHAVQHSSPRTTRHRGSGRPSLLSRPGIALYYELRQILRQQILRGTWRTNEKLPTEEELCQQYQVSRTVVRQALADLMHEGLVVRARGRGTYVAEARQDQPFVTFPLLAKQTFEAHGVSPHRLISSKSVLPDSRVATVLGLGPEDKVQEICRVRRLGRDPIVVEWGYLPISILPPGWEIKSCWNELFNDILTTHLGIPVVRTRLYLEAAPADVRNAPLLGIPLGTPVMIVERVRYTAGERPVLFTINAIRSDRYRFYFDLFEHEPNDTSSVRRDM